MRRTLTSACGVLLALAAAGCGSSSKSGSTSGARHVSFTINKQGCDPAHLELESGPVTFDVKNDGADSVTEMEVEKDGRILGEVENITPGLSRSFTVTLQPGTYETLCPNGTKTPKGELVVTGTATTTTVVAGSPAQKAVAAYRSYVEKEADALVTETTEFVEAVKANDVAKAKVEFPKAREHYETIEPVAESFGDLDPEIDAREGDVPADKWGGFHRIEKQLFSAGNADGMGPVADKLLEDVKELDGKIATLELEPATIANGAVELLNEVASSKITGEEDRYSHTDLWDIDANVSGSREAFLALRPIVAAQDEALAKRIDDQFAATDTALDAYKSGDGFALYTTLSSAQTKAIGTTVDALADSLAKVAPIVVNA